MLNIVPSYLMMLLFIFTNISSFSKYAEGNFSLSPNLIAYVKRGIRHDELFQQSESFCLNHLGTRSKYNICLQEVLLTIFLLYCLTSVIHHDLTLLFQVLTLPCKWTGYYLHIMQFQEHWEVLTTQEIFSIRMRTLLGFVHFISCL